VEVAKPETTVVVTPPPPPFVATASDTLPISPFLEHSKIPYAKPLPSAEVKGYRAGIEAYNADDFKTAQAELRNAARADELNWEIWFYFAISAYLNGDAREAIHGFEMVERRSPPAGTWMQSRWYLANAYVKAGSITRGVKVLEFVARQKREYAAESQALIAKIRELKLADTVIPPPETLPVRER
jgi:tetratricopeptide (TPR) repeat protein